MTELLSAGFSADLAADLAVDLPADVPAAILVNCVLPAAVGGCQRQAARGTIENVRLKMHLLDYRVVRVLALRKPHARNLHGISPPRLRV
ncbi:MAG: hypothetical protein GX862_09395 [Leucobacter sp.]|nr:hypothetical protein [Leucobacter sp.]